MVLPSLSSLKATLSTNIGPVLGQSPVGDAKIDMKDPLPTPKFNVGEEPTSPRAGLPAWHEGHWIIARPKLATPTIYQRSRSPANDRNTAGLGTSTPTGTRQSRHASSGRSSTRPGTPWSDAGVDTGAIVVQDWSDDYGQSSIGVIKSVDDSEQEGRNSAPFVDNPALDSLQSHVNDLYFATARPSFNADPVWLRRQRQSARAATGAFTNALNGMDRRTKEPPLPMTQVGAERAERLELGARILIRNLEQDRSRAFVAGAAAALQKALIFRDVRERVRDALPSTVTPLVSLFRHKNENDDGGHNNSRKHNESDGCCDGCKEPPLQATRVGKPGKPKTKRTEDKASVIAATCLRTLTLSEGLPEVMASASVIPSLIDELESGSPLMKSICGGCLASMACSDRDALLEMTDFGVIKPLLAMARGGQEVHELTAWGALAAIMDAAEARQDFVNAGGIDDVKNIIVRRRKKSGAGDTFLQACQEKALQVLVKFCEVVSDGCSENGSRGDTNSSAPHGGIAAKLPSTLADPETGSGCTSSNPSLAARRKRARSSEGAVGTPPTLASARAEVDAGQFVAQDNVFRALLRQMRKGTAVAIGVGAEILQRTWKACSRRQVDATIPVVVNMLCSDVWRLKSTAAQVVLKVYVEDEQRLACARHGAVKALIDMLCMHAHEMQSGTLAALLSLCEQPDVPALIVEAGGVAVLAEYLATSRDSATRYVVLATMKIALVCEKSAVEAFVPEMIISEHVMGLSEEVERFVEAFVAKRKASDYLRIGVENLCRFAPRHVAEYKASFKQLDRDGSGALDEEELKQLLKLLKDDTVLLISSHVPRLPSCGVSPVDAKKKNVRKVLRAADKNRSGLMEFDEFLDVMWDLRHAEGAARGALVRRTGVFLEDTLEVAQAAWESSQSAAFGPKIASTLRRWAAPNMRLPALTAGDADNPRAQKTLDAGVRAPSPAGTPASASKMGMSGNQTKCEPARVLNGTDSPGNPATHVTTLEAIVTGTNPLSTLSAPS